MTQKQLINARIISASSIVLGPCAAACALAVFFGGSERDPSWMWALYIMFFYGGLALAPIGFATFIGLLFVKSKDQ